MISQSEYEFACHKVGSRHVVVKSGSDYYAYGQTAQAIYELWGLQFVDDTNAGRVKVPEKWYERIIEPLSVFIVEVTEQETRWQKALRWWKETGRPFPPRPDKNKLFYRR